MGCCGKVGLKAAVKKQNKNEKKRPNIEKKKKITGVAQLIADLPPANFITIKGRLVCQNRNVCLGILVIPTDSCSVLHLFSDPDS